MKTHLTPYIAGALIFIGFLSFALDLPREVKAQNKLEIETTQYTVLSSNVFILGGAFFDNTAKKPITTYFQYKKDDSNFGPSDETIKIVRQSADVSGEFYTSPSLKLDSTYYFRAVGYFNDKENEKFYGNISSFRTGFPYPASFPFYVGFNANGNNIGPFIIPDCAPDVYNYETNSCITPLICTDPTTYNPTTDSCVMPLMCGEGEEANTVTHTCVLKNDSRTFQLDDPTYDEELDVPDENENYSAPAGGLVPCGNNGEKGCQYEDVIKLINNVINFILKGLVVPIAAIMFAYAGLLMMSAGGEAAGARTKAKGIFMNTVIGLVLIVGAFLIIKTFLVIIGYKFVADWF